MRDDFTKDKGSRYAARNTHLWGVLTLDDPDKNDAKHSRLIIQLQAYSIRPLKSWPKTKPNQKSADYSI